MNVQNSPIEPGLLHKKVERVGANASNLHTELLNAKNKPQDFLFKYKDFSSLIGSFNAINSLTNLNANALTLANGIADRGLELFEILEGYKPNNILNSQRISSFFEALRDLKQYCNDGLSWYRSAINSNENWRILNKDLEEQRVARMRADIEEMERSFIAMEARLTALGESADRSVARVEELTVQQADAMRSALTREVSDITDGFSSANQAFKDRLSEFDGFRDQATKLLSVMAAEALAGGHIESAKQEEEIANDFRERALTAMKWGGGTIGFILLISLFQDLTWVGIANRAMLVLLIVAPTAYLARESAKHRAQAVELRRASLDFAAIEPFLKGIQGEEGLKVRAELARRAFFSGNPVDATSSYGLDPQALLTKLMDTLSEVSKTKT